MQRATSMHVVPERVLKHPSVSRRAGGAVDPSRLLRNVPSPPSPSSLHPSSAALGAAAGSYSAAGEPPARPDPLVKQTLSISTLRHVQHPYQPHHDDRSWPHSHLHPQAHAHTHAHTASHAPAEGYETAHAAEAALHRSDAQVEAEYVQQLLRPFGLDTEKEEAGAAPEVNASVRAPLAPGMLCRHEDADCRNKWCAENLKDKERLPPLRALGFPLIPPVGKLGRCAALTRVKVPLGVERMRPSSAPRLRRSSR
jgi:hypothetical protein